MKLDKVLTVSEVALLAGWSRRRMLRRLQRIEERLGTPLLCNVGTRRKPRWTVTLGVLERLAPQWFVDEETLESRVVALEERVSLQQQYLDMQSERIAELAIG